MLTAQLKTFKVFCYGSNMSSRRILERCSTATAVAIAEIENYTFAFNKKSTDGSGKGNMVHTGRKEDKVWGVVFEIEEGQRRILEEFEGVGNGYNEIKIEVFCSEGIRIECIAYIATEEGHIDSTLIPYDWYKEHCIIGAKEFGLPEEYIKRLEEHNCKADNKTERAEKQRSIYS